jgi:methyltransferase (TIGR00027 family)
VKEGTPSRTAAWVAYARGMGHQLPPDARLADDPYGVELARGRRPRFDRAMARVVTPVILYMQVRTRVIDDAARRFVAGGGRQLVLLGAGYDTRALRMPELADVRVFEIDHPATQGRKRKVLADLGAVSPSHYLAWDFEQRALGELPGALAAAGCDPRARTFTIWEGVTMYLTEGAIDGSLRAIRTWSPPGSELAIHFFAKSRLAPTRLTTRLVKAVVARLGEPWRFGWADGELAPFLAARGFRLERDDAIGVAARELLPPRFAARVTTEDQRIAFAVAT